MASAEARATALLFSLSAAILVLLLLARADLLHTLRRGGLAGLLLAARDRGLLDLATRRNMILLCHAILLVILRDAGVLGAPSRRRRAGPCVAATAETTVAAAAADATEGACSAPAQPRTCRSVVVWRRPRNRAPAVHDATGRLVERQMPRRRPRTAAAEVAAPWAAPALAGQAAAQAEEPVATKEIVLVEKAPPKKNRLNDHHDRADIVEFQQGAACATDGTSSFDHRIVAAADVDETNANTAAEETREVELADDRRFDEFIARQRSMMRQESLQLVRSGSQAIATC